MRDKIVWSVRFRRARRTSVRRAAKSGAEKAKTSNFKQESVRIPTPYQLYGTYKKTIIIAVFAFSVRTILADPQRGEIKKMQKRRKPPRRRTSVRQRRVSAVEKADNHSLGEIR